VTTWVTVCWKQWSAASPGNTVLVRCNSHLMLQSYRKVRLTVFELRWFSYRITHSQTGRFLYGRLTLTMRCGFRSLIRPILPCHHTNFYRAMLCVARTMPSQNVFLSVHLSLCPSVTCRYSVKTVTYILKLFHCRVAPPF